MKYLISLLIVAHTLSTFSYSTISLQQCQNRATKLPEFPQTDTPDLINPDYSTFYRQITPGEFTNFFERLGIKQSNAPWHPRTLFHLLESVISTDSKKNPHKIVELSVDSPAHIIVLGNIHASFHSLIRILSQLHQDNIIDDNLTLINSDYYLVINGNAIGIGAYSIETLIVILTLIRENPDRVLYLSGRHEHKEYWHNFSFKKELQIRAGNYSDERIPYGTLLDAFFSSLADTVCITTKNVPDKNIYISSWRSIQDVNVTKDKNETIKAGIVGQSRMDNHRALQGLGMLDQDLGKVMWTTLSCPLAVYQQYINFTVDAFVTIDIQNTIENSTITLYNRPLESTSSNFEKKGSYTIATGQQRKKSEPVSRKMVHFGSALPYYNTSTQSYLKAEQAINLCINRENQQADMHDPHIRFVTLHNNQTIDQISKSISQLTTIYYVDTLIFPTIHSIDDSSKNSTLIFPLSGSMALRDQNLKKVINMRASNTDEVSALIDHMYTHYGTQHFAFLYHDDDYSIDMLNTAHKELEAKGITYWTDILCRKGSNNFSQQARKLLQSEATAIGIFVPAKIAQQCIRALGIECSAHIRFFSTSFLQNTSIERFAKRHGIKLLLSSVVPNPYRSSLPIVKEYQQLMDTYYYAYNYLSLEAYIGINLLMKIIKTMRNPITPESIIQQLESLKNYDLDGLVFNFDPITRSLSHQVWING